MELKETLKIHLVCDTKKKVTLTNLEEHFGGSFKLYETYVLDTIRSKKVIDIINRTQYWAMHYRYTFNKTTLVTTITNLKKYFNDLNNNKAKIKEKETEFNLEESKKALRLLTCILEILKNYENYNFYAEVCLESDNNEI